MPRPDALACCAILSAFAGESASAVKTSSSIAALIAAVFWYALMVSNKSAGDGAGVLVVAASGAAGFTWFMRKQVSHRFRVGNGAFRSLHLCSFPCASEACAPTELRFLADRRSSCSIACMPQAYPTSIPGLRSPFDQVNGLVYFGRMVDKMRLGAAAKLPPAWEAARGTKHKTSFDSRCCRFLQIDYAALEAEALKGEKSDAELLEWAFQHGDHCQGNDGGCG